MKKLVIVGAIGVLCGLAIGSAITATILGRAERGEALAAWGLGRHALERRDYGQAVMMFGRAVALSPGWYEPHFGLAQTYEQLGLADLALSEYQTAVDLANPRETLERIEQTRMLARIGNIHLQNGRYREAVDAFQRGVQVSPQWPEFYQGLVRAHRALGDAERLKQGLRDYVRYETREGHEGERVAAEKALRELE